MEQIPTFFHSKTIIFSHIFQISILVLRSNLKYSIDQDKWLFPLDSSDKTKPCNKWGMTPNPIKIWILNWYIPLIYDCQSKLAFNSESNTKLIQFGNQT